MNSFTLTAVGNLARNPEAVAKGDVTFTRFCLVGNDYAGKDDEGAPREIVTTLWFVAFGALAESLVRGARKGDQLFVEARVRSNNWTDKQGEKQYDLDFVVQGFRYGAPGKIKREERNSHRQEGMQRGDERSNGRDHETAATAGGDGSAADGHSPAARGSDEPAVTAGVKQSSSGPAAHAGAARSSSGTVANVGTEQSGPATERHSEKAAEKPTENAAEKLAEKPSGSRSSRRAAAPPP